MITKEPRSLEDFFKLFNDYSNDGCNYYRGQADKSWSIVPGISRNEFIKDVELLVEIEKLLLLKFKKSLIHCELETLLHKEKGYDESWIMLMVAQHCGLPTRLLDFSYDKTIALLFSVCDTNYLNKDGALIVFNNPNETQSDLSILKDPFNNKIESSFFIQAPILYTEKEKEPGNPETRKFIQASKFYVCNTHKINICLSKDKKVNHKLTKIHIPKELKLDIIKEIIKNGEMVYDVLAGKNELDYFATILKLEFLKFRGIKIDDYP